LREAEYLSDRGYEVLTCAVGGWRANKTAGEEMAVYVEKALGEMDAEDVIAVHCCDNTAFMARSEEGGDLPIHKFVTGEYHVEGDLVVAGKDRLLMFFRNCLPFLLLLKNRNMIFLTPIPRFLYALCCENVEHASNQRDQDFEADLRAALAEAMNSYKDFLFTSGLRGFSVLNPGLCVPAEDEAGTPLWSDDPFHPVYEGYSRITDMIVKEAEKLRHWAGTKRKGGSLAAENKRPRLEIQRPSWIEHGCSSTARQDGFVRGGQRGHHGQRTWVPRGC
jgi:hypothetical protein